MIVKLTLIILSKTYNKIDNFKTKKKYLNQKLI